MEAVLERRDGTTMVRTMLAPAATGAEVTAGAEPVNVLVTKVILLVEGGSTIVRPSGVGAVMRENSRENDVGVEDTAVLATAEAAAVLRRVEEEAEEATVNGGDETAAVSDFWSVLLELR